MDFKNKMQKKSQTEDAATKFFTSDVYQPAQTVAQKNRRVSLILNENLFQKLEKITEEKGVSKNAYITMALDDFLKNE